MVQPSLPIEVLEEIVGLHENAGNPSATLLSCLATSRQFRVCALKLICAEIEIRLNWPHRLKLLRDCITPGGIGPFIKSVVITYSSQYHYSPDQLDEDIIVSLFQILRSQVSVRKLSLRGNRRYCDGISEAFIWTDLPDQARQSLLSFSHAPNIEHISLYGLRNLPADILSQHTSKLSTFYSDRVDFGTRSFDILHMTLNPARLSNIRLPKLRHFATSHHLMHEHDSGWKIIRDCFNTLETIRICDAENDGSSLPIQFPPNINISMFLRLEEFVYSYHGLSWDVTGCILLKVLPFFRSPVIVPQLKVLGLHLSFDGTPTGHEDDFWVGRSNAIATDPSWAELGAILAKGHFPSLQKTCISLSFRISILSLLERIAGNSVIVRVANKEALKREVEDRLLETFSASLKALTHLEISVNMDF